MRGELNIAVLDLATDFARDFATDSRGICAGFMRDLCGKFSKNEVWPKASRRTCVKLNWNLKNNPVSVYSKFYSRNIRAWQGWAGGGGKGHMGRWAVEGGAGAQEGRAKGPWGQGPGGRARGPWGPGEYFG